MEVNTSQTSIDRAQLQSVLDAVSMFGGLSENQVEYLSGKFGQRRYAVNQVIFHEGDPASDIFILLSGIAQLEYEHDQHPLYGHCFKVGSCFGETSVIGIQPHSASVRTFSDVEVLVLSRENLMDIFNEDKEVFGIVVLNIARESCRRLNEVNHLLSSHSHSAVA
ncbi:Crp/Fnr family transcriptional regulator [Aurantivibrio plasticivorans]